MKLLDVIALGTPKSRVLVFGVGLMVLAILPTERLDLLPVRSVWETFFHFKPYSSGVTRSVSMILHGDWVGAWQMNWLGFAVVSLVGLIWVKDLGYIIRKKNETIGRNRLLVESKSKGEEAAKGNFENDSRGGRKVG